LTNRTILVTGEAGFIGSHIVDACTAAGYRLVHEVVCHHAALADVRASLADPQGYTRVNAIGALNLLEAAREQGGVRRVVFASTGGVMTA